MQANLLKALAIGAAQSITVAPASTLQLVDAPTSLAVQANFTYGSGGTTVDAWLQTSLDGGTTWIDIANFHFTTASARFVYNLNSQTPVTTEYTPTDGALAANTSKDGILGPLYQVKYSSTGTYAGGTTLTLSVSAQEP